VNDGLRKLLLAIAALAVLALLSACCPNTQETRLTGSGIGASAKRETAAFTRVELRGAAQVSIVAGRPRSVTVSGDDNLIGNVRTRVEQGTLVISQRRPFDSEIGMSVKIGVPTLRGIVLGGSGAIDARGPKSSSFTADLSGSGNIRLDHVTASRMRLVISGSGSLESSGTTRSLEVEIPGSGEAHLARLSSLDAKVGISGSGIASLRATSSLDASISGSGLVSYSGNPEHRVTRVTGSGAIEAR
jgi:hypothetical protein